MWTQLQKEWLAVSFLVAVTLFSGYLSFFVRPHKDLLREDGVKKWEERMKPIIEYLPPSTREVGYISDNNPTAIFQEYSITQYALAPVKVRQSVDFEWIIGNFTESGFESLLDEKIDTDFTIKKFGAGIYLIHRTLP